MLEEQSSLIEEIDTGSFIKKVVEGSKKKARDRRFLGYLV